MHNFSCMPASPDRYFSRHCNTSDKSQSGTQNSPDSKIPLHSSPSQPLSRNLGRYGERERQQKRKATLHALWRQVSTSQMMLMHDFNANRMTTDCKRSENLGVIYENKSMGWRASGVTDFTGERDSLGSAGGKEAEPLAVLHGELDPNDSVNLDTEDRNNTLGNANFTPAILSDFITFLTRFPHLHASNFPECHDPLSPLFRYFSMTQSYRYHEAKRSVGNDIDGAARYQMEGDVKLGPEGRPSPLRLSVLHSADHAKSAHASDKNTQKDSTQGPDKEKACNNDDHNWIAGQTSRYLLAGGVAGAVSRTATAPFDRLKIFLITRPPDLGGLTNTRNVAPVTGVKALARVVARLYAEGGVWAFWVGNGLSLVKIFPESAVKFMTYEQTKILFARYWDHVDDPRNISGGSRFVSGGMGGIMSQLFIYPLETLKTQMMSSTGEQDRKLASAMRRLWALGGIPAFYRGLVIGIIGVFPYSAIDMSTFEALKLAYLRSTEKDEPGVLALLAFGSISSSIGATSVYPINLIRTRLQASGSSGHPRTYSGVWDVATKTLAADGWRGFYRGLLPTLAKVIDANFFESYNVTDATTGQVVPSVSIGYLVYEHMKKQLGV